MGIKGLLGFLSGISKKSHIGEFRGSTIGVDVSCLLYKAAYSCPEKICLGNSTTEYLNYPLEVVGLLKHHDIKPVLVFDGGKLNAKENVNERRARIRTSNVEKGKDLWEKGERSEALKFFRQGIKVTCEMEQQLIKVLREKEIDYIVAPFEADAQLAFLEKSKIIDIVMTEDSDLLAFGCSKVLFKLDLRGNCHLVKRDELNKCLALENYKFDYFRHMCILAGCDYLDSIPGIGIKRAHTFMKKVSHQNMETSEGLPFIGNMIGVSVDVPEDYVKKFVEANLIFMHQSVFDPTARKEVYLEPLPEQMKTSNHFEIQLQGDIALDLCIGNIDTDTWIKVNHFSLNDFHAGGIWEDKTEALSVGSEASDDPEYILTAETGEYQHLTMTTRSSGLHFTVVSLGDELQWTVPSFPVLTIHFVKLCLEIDERKCNGLINQEDFDKLKDKEFPLDGTCDSHCSVSINDNDFIVLWKWELLEELKVSDCESDTDNSSIVSHISETDMSDSDNSIGDINLGQDLSDDDSDEIIRHTLPFKVMGVAHTNQNQTHLMRAEAKMYAENELVTACLVPETENEKDSNAISVQIDYGQGQHHVGYIAKELTQFIHPLLRSNSIASVEIGHIKFCLKWFRIGFYMKLMITRLGRWDPYVVSKAMRVS